MKPQNEMKERLITQGFMKLEMINITADFKTDTVCTTE